MAKNAKGDTIANGPAHLTAVTNYLAKHGPDARRDRALARLQQRRDPQAQLLVLKTRPGGARRERVRLEAQLAKMAK